MLNEMRLQDQVDLLIRESTLLHTKAPRNPPAHIKDLFHGSGLVNVVEDLYAYYFLVNHNGFVRQKYFGSWILQSYLD